MCISIFKLIYIYLFMKHGISLRVDRCICWMGNRALVLHSHLCLVLLLLLCYTICLWVRACVCVEVYYVHPVALLPHAFCNHTRTRTHIHTHPHQLDDEALDDGDDMTKWDCPLEITYPGIFDVFFLFLFYHSRWDSVGRSVYNGSKLDEIASFWVRGKFAWLEVGAAF